MTKLAGSKITTPRPYLPAAHHAQRHVAPVLGAREHGVPGDGNLVALCPPSGDHAAVRDGRVRSAARSRVPTHRLIDSMTAYRPVVEKGISRTAAARSASEQQDASKDRRTLERNLADIDMLLRPESTDSET